MFFLGDPCTLV